MAGGYQGKEMVRLEFHIIFLVSVYVISLEAHILRASFSLPFRYIAFPCVILFSAPLLPESGKEMSSVLLDFSHSHRELAAPCLTVLRARASNDIVTVPSASSRSHRLLLSSFSGEA